jgi:hypothetical protein
MRRSRTLALAPILAVVACDFGSSAGPQTSFSSAVVEWSESLTSAATVTSNTGAVIVDGLVVTPNQCHSIRPDLEVSGGTITLTITATQRISSCPEAAPGAFQYVFVASRFAPGTYRVRVFHTFQGGPAESMSERSVTIG